jgi:hypothetical protein
MAKQTCTVCGRMIPAGEAVHLFSAIMCSQCYQDFIYAMTTPCEIAHYTEWGVGERLPRSNILL